MGWITTGPLQSPHGWVPELCLALPWHTTAGDTQHGSPVLGLDKMNSSRVPTPPPPAGGSQRATIPTTRTRSRTWTLTSEQATRVSELHLATWQYPLPCTPGFSIKQIFPEYWPHGPGTHRTLINPHTVPSLNFAWLSLEPEVDFIIWHLLRT